MCKTTWLPPGGKTTTPTPTPHANAKETQMHKLSNRGLIHRSVSLDMDDGQRSSMCSLNGVLEVWAELQHSHRRELGSRPYIGGSDTRRFVNILRGLLCDVIGRLAPRAPVGQPPNDVTPYHRTTVPRASATRCWASAVVSPTLLSWKFRGSPAAA